MKNILF